jgi:hypothetical protein
MDLVKDFQSGGACEWVFKDVRRLPNYLASASLPLAGIRAMIERRHSLRNSGAAQRVDAEQIPDPG